MTSGGGHLPDARQAHGGTSKVEKVRISVALRELLDRLRLLAKDDRIGAVFPARVYERSRVSKRDAL